MNNEVIEMIVTVVCAVFASSGFWAIMMKRSERKDNKTKLLLGLAHDRIVTLGMEYVTRGYILQDEYDDINTYLYDPYHKSGGNGSAERVMEEVHKLKIFSTHADAERNGFRQGGN